MFAIFISTLLLSTTANNISLADDYPCQGRTVRSCASLQDQECCQEGLFECNGGTCKQCVLQGSSQCEAGFQCAQKSVSVIQRFSMSSNKDGYPCQGQSIRSCSNLQDQECCEKGLYECNGNTCNQCVLQGSTQCEAGFVCEASSHPNSSSFVVESSKPTVKSFSMHKLLESYSKATNQDGYPCQGKTIRSCASLHDQECCQQGLYECNGGTCNQCVLQGSSQCEAGFACTQSLSNSSESQVIGYYSWGWQGGSQGPPGANLGVAFTGLIDVATAISGYTTPSLHGEKYCSIGGGNAGGIFTTSAISKITAACKSGAFKGKYSGICYDIEIVKGSSSSVVSAFRESFAACKSSGLKVFVTTSHSAPYATDTPQVAVDLVKSWVSDSNIDILSPQLYSSGQERSPELAETNSCKAAGCTWDLWKNAKAIIAPSIVSANQYEAARSGLAQLNMGGYVVWEQLR